MSALHEQIVALKETPAETTQPPQVRSGKSSDSAIDRDGDSDEEKKRRKRVIGVIGLGAEGRSLVQRLLELGDRVVTYDKRAPGEAGAEHFNYLPAMLKTPGLEVAIDATRGRKLKNYVSSSLYCPLEQWKG